MDDDSVADGKDDKEAVERQFAAKVADLGPNVSEPQLVDGNMWFFQNK